MTGSIRLSPTHGLNPSLSQCFYCGGDKNELIIPGKLKGDAEAPRKAVWNMEPCDECKSLMEQGVMLIEANQDTPGEIFRTGCLVVVKDETIERMFDKQAAADAIKRRVAFVDTKAWDALGLPRENKDNRRG